MFHPLFLARHPRPAGESASEFELSLDQGNGVVGSCLDPFRSGAQSHSAEWLPYFFARLSLFHSFWSRDFAISPGMGLFGAKKRKLVSLILSEVHNPPRPSRLSVPVKMGVAHRTVAPVS